ncbi:meprin A subunit beta-like isoform X2 [Epinephelus fuscoguttatus]|uniref:meprin A subunit beta-like isoform X2 n=1 Tax=Epinephelus fuscoguttatus TaxID=293821 RepID=UPI0020D0844E|nr:meprin A subunit beta-like isoform X2 [Epinephelus fuscoguttatus]
MSAAGAMALRWIILFYGLGLAIAKLTGDTETDVDEGHDWDIFDINEAAGLNLLEGDIEQDKTFRNTIIGDKYRWPTTVPYYLEDSLEMNAKGVILKAFDQYRLKTCLDFTPWKKEKNYISVYKGSGCSSHVGNQRVGKQQLSIGKNCDSLGIVEHEFLHALGFWHEQSRADRDDYITIMWENIKSAKSSTFVDSCDFEEENICGMIQAPGHAKWEKRSSARGGPQTDFSNMGQCKGKGYFMHFSTASATRGARAVLESRWLYPKPGAQCLQFFLYNSGAADDVLNIQVRQYDKANPSGKLKLFKRISGGVKGSWELHNINLNMTQKARVVFEGVRGKKPSKGGLSLDDINLSSTKCPQHTWHIRNIRGLLATTPAGKQMYSPRFLSPAGYSFQVSVYMNGSSNHPGYLATFFHLTSGPNDYKLKWPCPWQQATMALMDQQSDIRQQMNMHQMVTTDPNQKFSDGTEYYWDNPRKVGSKVCESDGSFYYRGPGYGTTAFISHSRLKKRNFIKGDDAFFLFSLEDISDLLVSQPLPHSAVQADAGLMKAADQGALQGAANNPMLLTAVAVSVAAAMLVVCVLIIGNTWAMRRRRQQQIDKVAILQDMPGFME